MYISELGKLSDDGDWSDTEGQREEISLIVIQKILKTLTRH